MNSTISNVQVGKAVNALLKHLKNESESEELLPTITNLWIILTLEEMPTRVSLKPVPIKLPHSIIPSDASVCLFSKDPQSETKELVKALSLSRSVKVIGVSKLRSKYKPFEAKRALLDSFDLFLADERVLPVLPRLLGKKFFLKKKQPVPIQVKKSSLIQNLEDMFSSTFLHYSNGICISVRIGTTGLGAQENIENIMVGIEEIVKKIPKKWDNIQSIHLKSSESVALPIYAKKYDKNE